MGHAVTLVGHVVTLLPNGGHVVTLPPNGGRGGTGHSPVPGSRFFSVTLARIGPGTLVPPGFAGHWRSRRDHQLNYHVRFLFRAVRAC